MLSKKITKSKKSLKYVFGFLDRVFLLAGTALQPAPQGQDQRGAEYRAGLVQPSVVV